jgi:hypothetical protein
MCHGGEGIVHAGDHRNTVDRVTGLVVPEAPARSAGDNQTRRQVTF